MLKIVIKKTKRIEILPAIALFYYMLTADSDSSQYYNLYTEREKKRKTLQIGATATTATK